jgi:hypothetical protein
MNERITIYGTLVSFVQTFPEDYCLIIREEKTGDEWKIVASKYEIYEDLVEGHHYRCTGVRTLNGVIADEIDRWGRYCDVCGKWHTEGYYVLENDYACSEECAAVLYDGDWNALKADLALLDFPDTCDNAPTYWTEWE